MVSLPLNPEVYPGVIPSSPNPEVYPGVIPSSSPNPEVYPVLFPVIPLPGRHTRVLFPVIIFLGGIPGCYSLLFPIRIYPGFTWISDKSVKDGANFREKRGNNGE